MRFHLPFDDVQWNQAAAHHTNMRAYTHALREEFPPKTTAQRSVLGQLRTLVQNFGRELLKPRDRIDAVRLNELSEAMIKVAVEYIALYEMFSTD